LRGLHGLGPARSPRARCNDHSGLGDPAQTTTSPDIESSALGRRSCFDNAAAEAFYSTLEWEVLPRREFTYPDHARQVVTEKCSEFCNTQRRNSSAAMMKPVTFETYAASNRRRHKEPSTISREPHTRQPRLPILAAQARIGQPSLRMTTAD